MRQLPDYGDGRKLAEKAPNFWSVPSILPVLLDEHGNGDYNDDHNRYNDNFCQHKSVSLLSFNCAYDTDLLFVRCMNSICEILMCIFPAFFLMATAAARTILIMQTFQQWDQQEQPALLPAEISN